MDLASVPNLQSLRLDVLEHRSWGEIGPSSPLDFLSVPLIQSVEIRFGFSSSENIVALRCLTERLWTPSAPPFVHLTSIIIRIHFEVRNKVLYQQIREFKSWPILDKVLTGPGFPALEDVAIYFILRDQTLSNHSTVREDELCSKDEMLQLTKDNLPQLSSTNEINFKCITAVWDYAQMCCIDWNTGAPLSVQDIKHDTGTWFYNS